MVKYGEVGGCLEPGKLPMISAETEKKDFSEITEHNNECLHFN